MKDFIDFETEPTDTGTMKIDQPLYNDVQILQIAQQLEPSPISNVPDVVNAGDVTNNDAILNQQYFSNEPFNEPPLSDNSGEIMTSFVTPLENSNSFQLLPSITEPSTIQPASEANTMLDFPLEDTNYQQGSAIEDLPPIDVVDVEPPKYITDLEEFPTVVNDVDKNAPVTVVVKSAQTGEQVAVQTIAEKIPDVVAAAVVADAAIQKDNTAQTTQTQDLLFGYDRQTVYVVGAIAGLALLIGISSLGEE